MGDISTRSPSADDVAVALAELDKPATRSYTGRVGCACGCRGRYSAHTPTMKATATKIRRALTERRATWLAVIPGSFVGVDLDNGRALTVYTGADYSPERMPI